MTWLWLFILSCCLSPITLGGVLCLAMSWDLLKRREIGDALTVFLIGLMLVVVPTLSYVMIAKDLFPLA